GHGRARTVRPRRARRPARPGPGGHRPPDRAAGGRARGPAGGRVGDAGGRAGGPVSGASAGVVVPPGARLVLATHNAHKVGELRAILAPALPGLDASAVVGAGDVHAPAPVEDGVT